MKTGEINALAAIIRICIKRGICSFKDIIAEVKTVSNIELDMTGHAVFNDLIMDAQYEAPTQAPPTTDEKIDYYNPENACMIWRQGDTLPLHTSLQLEAAKKLATQYANDEPGVAFHITASIDVIKTDKASK